MSNQGLVANGGMPPGKFQFNNRDALRVLAGVHGIQRRGAKFYDPTTRRKTASDVTAARSQRGKASGKKPGMLQFKVLAGRG